MQFLKDPKFDFMGRGKLVLAVSGVVVLLSIGALGFRSVTQGSPLNLGIEFTGGTELQLKFVDTPDVSAIRSTLSGAGLTSQVSRFQVSGDPDVADALSELNFFPLQAGRLSQPRGTDPARHPARAAPAQSRRRTAAQPARSGSLARRRGEPARCTRDRQSSLG